MAFFAKLASGERNVINSRKGKQEGEQLILKKGNSKYISDEKKTKFKKRKQ